MAGVDGPEDGRDRRQFERVTARLEIDYWAESQRFRAHVADLSEGGLFLDTPNPVPAGTTVTFKFCLPDDPQPIEGEGQVVWHEPNVGMAVAFTSLEPRYRDRIKLFIVAVGFDPA